MGPDLQHYSPCRPPSQLLTYPQCPSWSLFPAATFSSPQNSPRPQLLSDRPQLEGPKKYSAIHPCCPCSSSFLSPPPHTHTSSQIPPYPPRTVLLSVSCLHGNNRGQVLGEEASGKCSFLRLPGSSFPTTTIMVCCMVEYPSVRADHQVCSVFLWASCQTQNH